MRRYVLAAVAGAALAGAVRADSTRVLVLPFNTLRVPDAQQWIGKGVQETLVADMANSADIVPVAFQGTVIVEDNATAARLARQAQASLAIRGVAQVSGNDVRLTAQILDAKTGELLRIASAIGPVTDLLKLEGELTAQLRGPAQPPVASLSPRVAPAAASLPLVVVIPQPAPPLYYPFPPYPPALYPYYYPNNYLGWSPGNYTSFGTASGGGRMIIHTHTGPNTPNSLPIPTGGDWLPLPTNNVLPIPTNNVLPLPTNNILPLPKNNVQPLPKSAAALAPTQNMLPVSTISAVPQVNAGQKR